MSETASEPDNDFYTVQARHVRRCMKEAWIALAIWSVALVYCAVACIRWGYIPSAQRPEVPEMILGFPAWVFWAIIVPWFVMTFATWGFALFCMKDDEPIVEMPGRGEKSAIGGAEGDGNPKSENRNPK